ncbi:Tll0287-like domain-containing protein [Rhodopseudomonas parapalustris]
MSTRAFIAFIVVAAAAFAALAARDRAVDQAALQAEARSVIKDYSGALLGVLKSTMESSGPVEAIGFCNREAPTIAATASQRSGWTVARTSLKPRNPSAAPDDLERRVMTEFVAQIATGTPAASLHHAEIVDQNGEKVFRYIQAIPTAELCLTCHGRALRPDVAAKIQALYPDDQATGFAPGQMRGAFTLSRKL